MPGRLSRAMRAKASPFGVPSGNRTRVISSSIRFGCSKASMPDIESKMQQYHIQPLAGSRRLIARNRNRHGLRQYVPASSRSLRADFAAVTKRGHWTTPQTRDWSPKENPDARPGLGVGRKSPSGCRTLGRGASSFVVKSQERAAIPRNAHRVATDDWPLSRC